MTCEEELTELLVSLNKSSYSWNRQ